MKVLLQFMLLLTVASAANAQTQNGFARVCAADMYPDKSANKSGPINVYWSVWEPVTVAHFEYISPDAFWNYLKAQYPPVSQNFYPASNLRCFGFRPDNRDPRPEFKIGSIREAIAMMDADLARRGFSGSISHVMTKFRFYNDSYADAKAEQKPAAQTSAGASSSPTSTSPIGNPSPITTEEVVDLVSTGIQVLGSMWEERAAKKRAEEAERALGAARYAQSVAETRRYVEQEQAQYRDAALRGDAEAQYQMARAHRLVLVDHEYHQRERLQWLSLAAKQGHPGALSDLADGMRISDTAERERLYRAALANPIDDALWKVKTNYGLGRLFDPFDPVNAFPEAERKLLGFTGPPTRTDVREAYRYYREAVLSLDAARQQKFDSPFDYQTQELFIKNVETAAARLKRHPYFCDRETSRDIFLELGLTIHNQFRCLFSGDRTQRAVDIYRFAVKKPTTVSITLTRITDVGSLSIFVTDTSSRSITTLVSKESSPAVIELSLDPGVYRVWAATDYEPFMDKRYQIEILENGTQALTLKDIGARIEKYGFLGLGPNQNYADAPKDYKKKFYTQDTRRVILEAKLRFKPEPTERLVQTMCVRYDEGSSLPRTFPRPYLTRIKPNEAEMIIYLDGSYVGQHGTTISTKCWSGSDEIISATYRADSRD